MVFMDYQALYDEWLTSPCFDEATKAELRGISEEEKKDRFYTELEFGTAGLRGLIHCPEHGHQYGRLIV